MHMNKKKDKTSVGAAVIGLGRGRAHVNALLRAEGAELLAVCDKNKDAAEAFAAQYGVDAYTDMGEMLKRGDIDLVHVCTPSGLHTEMLLQIAAAGKHAITEKPLDISLERIDSAIDAFARRDLQLGCIFQIRLMPAVREMKQAIEAGRLGKLILANAHVKWFRTQQYYDQNGGWRGTWAWDGGGSLMNQAVHTIDLLQWMMGPVQSVVGHTQVSAHTIETEDMGVALVKFANGAFGTIVGTTGVYPGFGTSLEIFGSDGGIAMKDNLITDWKIRGENMAAEEADMLKRFGDGKGQGEATAAPPADTTYVQIQDMVDAVRNNRPPMITGREGRDAVEIVLAIYESARTGKEIFLPLKK
ncbi:MAG: oxidoreductase [Paenibacillus sp.]|nr:oxidoreductase [Paenibacillus sp.]